MSKLSSACAQVAADALFAASVDALLVPFYKPDGPGAAVIVTRAGKAVFRHAYGMACIAQQQPMTPQTTFRLARSASNLRRWRS